jgi:UDP-2,3-diacylglucosamine hydrolase
MSPLPVYVVSDIHLGAVPEATEKSFRKFLGHVGANASKLVINGDLFDFWFEYRTVIPSRHYRVLAALAEIPDAGIDIHFIGGNHDAWAGDFLRKEVGLDVLPDASELILAGRKALIVHGDGLGQGDIGYRILKKVIRNPISILAFRALHPDWGSGLARMVSTTEGKMGNAEGANAVRAAELSSWAEGTLQRRDDLDLILAGHTHTPAVTEFQPNRFYVNTGDWINHYTYLTLDQQGSAPELHHWL